MKLDRLRKLDPCSEAIDWLEQGKFKTNQDAWDKCKRGDWMLWLCDKLSGKPESKKRKKLVLASCGCARLALKWVTKGEERPRIAIETAERWAVGKSKITEVRAAAAAAADAAYYAAYYAAAAAYYAADADAAAAAAAYYAAYYAAAADADAAAAMLSDCADVVRKYYPKAPL